ncbi:outer membrane beta-barrel protein [Pedobacter steynii]|uniref:Outer membrane protein beta-barrel domain-containing protein n=1 Tax=Pedobacter steynii TaxID=430522 RepID=A0A1D7QCZ7_9SPHI|nr:outer membrane beta-barrel protein [Pedobacter steynii]AOM76566.1 hypothetical protein BFS30_04985 [Pedobacter steynii]
MEPNEHIKLPEDELITHIRESLMAHEEEYVPGAWEDFIQEEPRKKGLLFWLAGLGSAAAVLLIGFGIFFAFEKNTIPGETEVVINKPLQKKPFSPQIIDNSTENNIVQKETRLITAGDPKDKLSHYMEKGPRESMVNVLISDERPLVIQNKANQEIVNPVPEPEKVVAKGQVSTQTPQIEKKPSFEDFLNQESKQNALAKSDKTMVNRESKWEMGLVVAPSLGNNKKLSMGYGVTMGYSLSDKVSINSGLSYSEMGASRSVESPPNTVMMSLAVGGGVANESRELKSVNARLRGIDIPLEIKYHLSKRVYANVGISAFAVLDQKQQNTFIESKVEPLAYNNDGGTAKAMVLNRTVSEEAPKEEVKNDPYLGFYNFSVGYKQKISKGKAFSVEPFIKLPMKELKQENLYLIGTGLRLKFDF